MSEIEDWKTSLLPSLLHFMKSGGTPDTSRNDYYGGEIPFVSIEDLTSCGKFVESAKKKITHAGLKNSNTWLVPEYSILYSIYATLGIPRINLIPVTTNQAILALINNKEKIDVNYLYYWLESIRASVVNLSSQTTQSNLSSTTVKSFSVHHPIQLQEQSQIAEILSTVDRAIEQTAAMLAKQQRLKTGLMHDLLTRGIDAHGNLRNEHTHEFKVSPLGRIPVEWDVVPLGRVAEISSGVTLGKTHEGPSTVELPYLRVANVQDGYLDLSDVKFIRIPLSSVEKHSLKPGDVLMNEGGDFDKLGRGSVWRGEVPGCIHQNHVFKVRPKSQILASDYLASVSSSPYGKAFFVMASKQSTNLASINSTQLKSFSIPLPSYEEQLRIEESLKNSRGIDEQSKTQLTKLRALKTGLMQDLLSGHKRVTDLLVSNAI